MDEIVVFGRAILVVALGFLVALLSRRVTERLRVPAPALFLVGAALARELEPAFAEVLTIRDVERIGVVALILILFDGGMEIGWAKFRASAIPIASLGVLGTFATAGIIAAAANLLLGFDWTTAWILGAALAPTDPATTFSVLGGREVGGRTGTILQGESGANDPVGIALMLGLIELAATDGGSPSIVVTEFSVAMGVGLVVGVAGGVALRRLARISLPAESLYPLRVLAIAGVIYGAASIAHGSGFLAVFVAGILFGDERAPHKPDVERFHSGLASLAEIAVFAALGLTVDVSEVLVGDALVDALVLFAVMAAVARPIGAGVCLLPARLTRGEKGFVLWSGLKGAVPILLAAFAVLAGVDQADRVYTIVFVVVLLSVVLQGSLVPTVAARARVPMHVVTAEPWDLSVRLRHEPRGVRRFVVDGSARAAGRAIRDLPITERTWISMVLREGQAVQARGDTVLDAGDELVVFAEEADERALSRLFEGRPGPDPETAPT